MMAIKNLADLPTNVQMTAASMLSQGIDSLGGIANCDSEPAKKLARNIRDVFIELYCSKLESSSQSESVHTIE